MTSEEATAFEEDAGDKYADLNKQFLEYDPDSSEMDRDNEASEEGMKVRYIHTLCPRRVMLVSSLTSSKLCFLRIKLKILVYIRHCTRFEKSLV